VKEQPLSDPPRALSPQLSRNLWWGTPSMVFSMTNFFTVLLSALFMFLIYGIPVGALLPQSTDSVRVTSQIQEKESELLPSGGKVSVVMAPVKVNDVVIEVRGYGPKAEVSEKGDSVEIAVPRAHPTEAELVGFDRYPVKPKTLLILFVLFSGPGLLVAVFSWRSARRKRKLLTCGRETQGKRLRRIPLPRPLKDMVLVRWEYSSDGDTGRFWTLQKAELENPPLVVAGSLAAVRPNLLPEPVIDGQTITSISRGEKYGAIINWILLALCLISFVVFLFL
jgi:hypothetical protein